MLQQSRSSYLRLCYKGNEYVSTTYARIWEYVVLLLSWFWRYSIVVVLLKFQLSLCITCAFVCGGGGGRGSPVFVRLIDLWCLLLLLLW